MYAIRSYYVLVQNEKDEWIKVGEVGETGPISADIKIVPLISNSNSRITSYNVCYTKLLRL